MSAESGVDPAALRIQWEKEKKTYPKSDAEKERIRNILKGNVLFQVNCCRGCVCPFGSLCYCIGLQYGSRSTTNRPPLQRPTQQGLDEDTAAILVDAMFPEEHNDGDVIIRQGDQGKNFYVVDAGTPEVYLRDKDSDTEKKVLSYTEGDSFGELALMYNAPRAATVKASGAVKLWALDRLTFRVILQDSTMKKRDMHKTFLEKVRQGGLYHLGVRGSLHFIVVAVSLYLSGQDPLQPLRVRAPHHCRLAGARVLPGQHQDHQPRRGRRQVLHYREGNAAIAAAAAAQPLCAHAACSLLTLLICEQGEVVCTVNANGEEREVLTCKEGNYFGEIALLTNQPRKATVSAAQQPLAIRLRLALLG